MSTGGGALLRAAMSLRESLSFSLFGRSCSAASGARSGQLSSSIWLKEKKKRKNRNVFIVRNTALWGRFLSVHKVQRDRTQRIVTKRTYSGETYANICAHRTKLLFVSLQDLPGYNTGWRLTL